VLVPALVRTKSGAPVFTLTADQFLLTDDDAPQTVSLDEDAGSQPLALVVAVQTGGAGTAHLDNYRNLGPLIEAVVGDVPHRIAVVRFDSTPELVQDFTPDLDVAGGRIQSLSAGDGGAAILDALAFSVDTLSKQPAEYRRAVLLISETFDHGSHIDVEEAVRKVSDTNTAIYSFGFSSPKAETKHEASRLGGDPEPGPAKGCMAKDPNADPATAQGRVAQTYDCLSLLAPPLRAAKIAAMLIVNSLRRNVPETVAHLTGGEFYEFKDGRSLERDLVTLSNHIPNRYFLSFHPQSPHPGLHTIRLKLKDYPNLVITARSSYWAESPAPAEAHP
jgi:VWFA-related protein